MSLFGTGRNTTGTALSRAAPGELRCTAVECYRRRRQTPESNTILAPITMCRRASNNIKLISTQTFEKQLYWPSTNLSRDRRVIFLWCFLWSSDVTQTKGKQKKLIRVNIEFWHLTKGDILRPRSYILPKLSLRRNLNENAQFECKCFYLSVRCVCVCFGRWIIYYYNEKNNIVINYWERQNWFVLLQFISTYHYLVVSLRNEASTILGYDPEAAPCLQQCIYPSTRGHTLKLYQLQSHLNCRKCSFTVRVAERWNKLPDDVVNAPSIPSFENRLDKHWACQEFLYDFKAQLPWSWYSLHHTYSQDLDI